MANFLAKNLIKLRTNFVYLYMKSLHGAMIRLVADSSKIAFV